MPYSFIEDIIDENKCMGDTLPTINNNYVNLDTGLAAVSATSILLKTQYNTLADTVLSGVSDITTLTATNIFIKTTGTLLGLTSATSIGIGSLSARTFTLVHDPANDGVDPIFDIGETQTGSFSGFRIRYEEPTNRLVGSSRTGTTILTSFMINTATGQVGISGLPAPGQALTVNGSLSASAITSQALTVVGNISASGNITATGVTTTTTLSTNSLSANNLTVYGNISAAGYITSLIGSPVSIAVPVDFKSASTTVYPFLTIPTNKIFVASDLLGFVIERSESGGSSPVALSAAGAPRVSVQATGGTTVTLVATTSACMAAGSSPYVGTGLGSNGTFDQGLSAGNFWYRANYQDKVSNLNKFAQGGQTVQIKFDTSGYTAYAFLTGKIIVNGTLY